MDGEMALKFVRSRKGTNGEGTDFARSKRQQKVITAIQKKVLSPSVMLSPSKVKKLINIAKETIETDIDTSTGAILARRLVQSKDNINSYVLDGEFLENPPTSFRYDNLYVFVPIAGDWSGVHGWIEEILP
jgi:anionic cell wall polymer biosynthesis LytR-Cps2A-Psr (LCP) family protein